jgi:methylated-DNA-[protein]-cysteine S-methyltransferase
MASLSISSPIGNLVVDEDDDAITAIRWADEREPNGSKLLAEAARQLDAYFVGKLSHFDLPLRPAGSDFDHRVWSAMQKIPYGKTHSYGELAAEIGSAPRAVGGACGKNPIPIVIPCHRVLAKTGLGGYSGSGGVKTKQALLTLEGAL